MGKARNNIATRLWVLGRLAEANAHWVEADAVARRYGAGSGVLWSQMELTGIAITEGDFATALTRADELMAATASATRCTTPRDYCATGLSVRGELEEALSESTSCSLNAHARSPTRSSSSLL